MTLQNIQTDNESVHAVSDSSKSVSDSSKSKQDTEVSDAGVVAEPVTTKPSDLEKYCATNPGAAECRIYDV